MSTRGSLFGGVVAVVIAAMLVCGATLGEVATEVEHQQVRQVEQIEGVVDGFHAHFQEMQERQLQQAWQRGDRETAQRIISQLDAADSHRSLAKEQIDAAKAEMGIPVEGNQPAKLSDIPVIDRGKADTSGEMATMPLVAAGGTLAFFALIGVGGVTLLLRADSGDDGEPELQ